MEIKPTKLVGGKGICQLIADNKSIDEVVLENEGINQGLPHVLFVSTTDEWYSNLAYLLTYEDCPAHLSRKEKQTLKLKVENFVLWENGLYKKGLDGNFLCYVDKQQQDYFKLFMILLVENIFLPLLLHTRSCMLGITSQHCLKIHTVGFTSVSNVNNLLVSLN